MTDLARLSASQNPDGGWPYEKGSSWTEPTVYAVLAFAAAGETSSPGIQRALQWLRAGQRTDGGWAPRESVEESTWVTALLLLLPGALLAGMRVEPAVEWLMGQTGRESSWVERARRLLISGRAEPRMPDGWPWFPDTAAWVAPTSLAILALGKVSRTDPKKEIRDRIQQGREFLVSRMCADGGWNHGSSRALGYDGPSYPETTGLALAALKGWPAAGLRRSIERGQYHLRSCRSVEAASWLQLGLLAQGRELPAMNAPLNPSFTTQSLALAVIAQESMRGHRILEG